MSDNMKIVHVVWLDSEMANEWTNIADVGGLERTHSSGILIRETDTFILLALSFDPATESINGFKKIPKSAIERMRVLCRLKMNT